MRGRLRWELCGHGWSVLLKLWFACCAACFVSPRQRAKWCTTESRPGRTARGSWANSSRGPSDRRRPGVPRRRIGDLYKHFLDEAGTLVTPRQPSETPDEYRRDVELVVPAAGPDLSELTEVFNEARYSLHVIGTDHVEKAAAAVRQLGTLLTAHASRTEGEPEIGDSG